MVSIIIPYYNNEDTIVKTLDSVYNQSYNDIEVILVNDGSTNAIFSNIKYYIDSKKLIYLSQINKGVSFARNYGASIAKGRFLLFLDADDLIDSSYIYKCIEVYKKKPELKIVYSDAQIFGRENKKWELNNYTSYRDFLISNCIFISALIKKEDFENANGFDTELDFYEDWELWISILKDNGQVYKIPEELFFYRKNDNQSSTSDLASKQIHAKNRLKIYFKHYSSYEKEFAHFEEVFLTYLIYTEKNQNVRKKWYQRIFKKEKH